MCVCVCVCVCVRACVRACVRVCVCVCVFYLFLIFGTIITRVKQAKGQEETTLLVGNKKTMSTFSVLYRRLLESNDRDDQ